MLRSRFALLIVCVFVSIVVLADRPAIPTLTAEGDDGRVALELTALRIHATIRGHLARTEFELTYRNSLDRVTGGEFRFPIPADAEVSDLGLYFNGHLRHGVAIERVLARTAYDETVHRGVDPALVEWSAGRAFTLNVFPIPAKGEKKVFIAYDQELIDTDYVLDLRYGRALQLDATIDSDGRALTVDGALHFAREGTAYAMHTRDVAIDGVVRVAREENDAALVAHSAQDAMWYAAAAVKVAASNAETAPADHVLILYDTSSSSVQQKAPLLRRFLTSFLARQNAWAAAEVIPFHIALEPPRRIEKAGTPAGQREIERVVSELQPLGATNLLAVTSQLGAIAASLPRSTRIVLVTDGLTSLGDSRDLAAAIAKLGDLHRPLLVVHASSTADDQLLANAARASGGWSIDLARTDVDAAVASAMRVPSRIRFTGSEVMPQSVLVTGGGRVAIAARAKSSVVALPRTMPARELREAREASMIRRAWARARLREMLAGGASDEDLIAHGRAFTQLTPRTSLLVLETWWDYERYGIELPPDLVELKAREQGEAQRRLEEAQRRAGAQPLPSPVVTPGTWVLRGRVITTDGFPLPGVTVSLYDGNTPLDTRVTNEDGAFAVFAAVPPKDPRLRAELSGMNDVQRAFSGELSSGGSIDLVMSVATVAESITVTAAAPVVETTAAMASTLPSIRDGGMVSADSLLRTIAREDPANIDDPDVIEAVARRRVELTKQVIARLRAIGSTTERVRYYLSARAFLGGDKSFHVFAAEVFRDRSPEIAARVLSDLAEARPDDAPLLRILARVLDGWGEADLARLLLRRAIEVSPREVQSWRELILLEARRGRPSEVASWTRRMNQSRRTDLGLDALYEQTAEALARWERASVFDRQGGVDVRVDPVDDLTIELMWDFGWSYVDLHVTEPHGETVKWDHDASSAGGRLTGGYIFGYGPQIYTLRNARPGNYRLDIDYYSQDAASLSLETLAHVVVYARGKRYEHFVVLQFDDEHRTLQVIRMDRRAGAAR